MEELESPLVLLQRLAAEKASGEVVAASGSFEAHVYFLRGQVAWASSSAAKHLLTRHLITEFGVDPAAIREVVKECQRTRKRFGETLVEWNVASKAQVRSALQVQITEVIHTLAAAGAVRALFLPRTVEYSPDLLFDLAEVMTEAGVPPSDFVLRANEMVRSVAKSLPEASWVEVLREGAVAAVHHRSGMPPPSVLLDLASRYLGPQADALSIRLGLGSILGVALPEDRASLWCAVQADAKLGLAVSLLFSHARRSLSTPRPQDSPAPWISAADAAVVPSFAPIEDALRQADELVAVIAVKPGEPRLSVARRQNVEVASLAGPAGELSRILHVPFGECFVSDPSSMAAVTYEKPCVQAARQDFWFFGTTLSPGSPICLWLVLHRSAPPGFGWALLATVARQLASGNGHVKTP